MRLNVTKSNIVFPCYFVENHNEDPIVATSDDGENDKENAEIIAMIPELIECLKRYMQEDDTSNTPENAYYMDIHNSAKSIVDEIESKKHTNILAIPGH